MSLQPTLQPFPIPEQIKSLSEPELVAYIDEVRTNTFVRLGIKAAARLKGVPPALTDWLLGDSIPSLTIARAVRIQVEHPDDPGQYLRNDPLTRELFLKMIEEV